MIDDLFSSGWTIERFTEAPDSGGAVTETWVTHLSDVKARKRKLSGREVIRNFKDEVVADYRIYTAVADITEKDRIKNKSGQVFNVVFVDNPHDLNEFLQIDVLRTDVEREQDG